MRIAAIREDRFGNLLVGTFGGGLNIFNRDTFSKGAVVEGLSDNLISSITLDRENNLWVGTWKGGSTS